MCKMMVVTFKQNNYVGNAYFDYDPQKGNLLSNIESYFIFSDKIRSDCNLAQSKDNKWLVQLKDYNNKVIHLSFLCIEYLMEIISNVDILNTTIKD